MAYEYVKFLCGKALRHHHSHLKSGTPFWTSVNTLFNQLTIKRTGLYSNSISSCKKSLKNGTRSRNGTLYCIFIECSNISYVNLDRGTSTLMASNIINFFFHFFRRIFLFYFALKINYIYKIAFERDWMHWNGYFYFRLKFEKTFLNSFNRSFLISFTDFMATKKTVWNVRIIQLSFKVKHKKLLVVKR